MNLDLPLLRPFVALRPTPSHALAVVAPPYDVLTSEEARHQVMGRPYSFLHVSKAEIDLPHGTDAYAPAVYAKAAENLKHFVSMGVLVREYQACFYVYRMSTTEHTQTGISGAAAVEAYETGRIRRHELTRPDKESDRVNQIKAVDAHTGPVLATYRPVPIITEVIEQTTMAQPLIDIFHDGVHHTLWRVAREPDIAVLLAAFRTMPALYIADGHHRSAAAAQVAAARRVLNPCHRGDEMYNSFLVVSFPTNEMRILNYNRVVCDLNGLARHAFLARIAESCTVIPCPQPVQPVSCDEVGLYLPGQWYRLVWAPILETADPVVQLSVTQLANRILSPILGLHDLRQDQRIDFVGGIHGLGILEQRVNSGEMAAAFVTYPPSIEELIAVTDAGQIMPPKSTWFEPKLVDGLLSLPLN